MDNILSTKALGAGYGKKIVVDDIEITIPRGKITVLIGPNGSGKSTVLKTITRSLAPVKGTVFLDGGELSEINGKALARKMSVLLTERTDTELMTCREVVEMGRYPYTGQLGILSAHDKECVLRAMELTMVTDLAQCEFCRLSDGQRQRVMLASAICREPEILVLDEPTSFLDICHRFGLINILRRLARERNMAVVMSVHELDLARRAADLVISVNNGKIDKVGMPHEVFTSEYITALYGIAYEAHFGSAELEAADGEPDIFVIAGGGSGADAFRELQRRGIPFAAGVIHENDLDYPAAKALAVSVISEKPFEPVSESALEAAISAIKKCSKVICCIENFGSMNANCSALVRLARAEGKLIQKGEFLNG